MLARLAHLIARRRWLVIGVWIALTLFGGFAAGKVSKRWYQSFSIPGKSAYEASQRTLKTLGVGCARRMSSSSTRAATRRRAPRSRRDARARRRMPGALTSSYFSTHDPIYVSHDRHTTFLEVYPPGGATFDTKSGADDDARRSRRACRPGSR